MLRRAARSLKVRENCIQKVKDALDRCNYSDQKDLANDLGIGLSTLSNFLNGKRVDRSNFHEICLRLNLNSEDVADFIDSRQDSSLPSNLNSPLDNSGTVSSTPHNNSEIVVLGEIQEITNEDEASTTDSPASLTQPLEQAGVTRQKMMRVIQQILINVQAGGSITVGDITQVYNIIGNLDKTPKPIGIPQNIPSSSTEKFLGREKELERLHQQLQRNNEVVIAAVEGIGGVGKTELAIQYSLLHLQLHTYPGGICWLRLREQDIELQIVEFARTDLGLQPPEDLELPKRVRWCWKHWHQGNKLIVLDDVKDYRHIKPFLPPQPSEFKVLITTRLKLDLAGSMFLEVLSETTALQLLAQLVGEKKVTQELTQARDLCQRLGYLPLAFQLVGQYVKKRKISLTEMLRRLESKGLGHDSLAVNENDPTWTSNLKRGVAAAFELSWEELSEPAQQLGCLLSLFALAPIPWLLVVSAAPKHDLEQLEAARVELENLHLLQGEDTYRLHQLIREFLRGKQKELAVGDEQKYSFCQAMVEVAKEISQTPTQKEISVITSAILHLAEVAQNLTATVSDENLIWVFEGLNRFYSGQGLYVFAEPWCKQCVSVVSVRLGEEHPDVATSYDSLASLYYSQAQYAEAEFWYKKALGIRQRLLPEEHLDVATSYNNLGLLYKSEKNYEEAEPLLVKALKIKKRLLTEEHPSVAISYNNLGSLYSAKRCYAKAEPLLLKALEIKKRLFTEEHPSIANSYSTLASLYNDQKCYAKAEPLYKEEHRYDDLDLDLNPDSDTPNQEVDRFLSSDGELL